ncbi:MAG: hypothetical protein SGI74_09535 [Oligoflexia bacterium]|nr:hypothetical protein [Oligoflexia bacterium]
MRFMILMGMFGLITKFPTVSGDQCRHPKGNSCTDPRKNYFQATIFLILYRASLQIPNFVL